VLDLLVPLDGIELSTFALRMRKKWRFSTLKGMRQEGYKQIYSMT